MTIIYFVVACILSAIAWVTTELNLPYAYIATYIFIFLASLYVSLFLV